MEKITITEQDLQEGLDEEDVAAALDQRAEEYHLGTGKVRAAYYNAYCYLRDLEEAGMDLKNTRLQNDAAQALNHLQHIDPTASNYNAAANTDDGTCAYNNAYSNLPATVDMDWADMYAGNFGYASMPITFTKNPNQNTTETFKDEAGTDFTTNLFYTGAFNIYGSNYIGYLAFSDTYDGYGDGTPRCLVE